MSGWPVSFSIAKLTATNIIFWYCHLVRGSAVKGRCRSLLTTLERGFFGIAIALVVLGVAGSMTQRILERNVLG